MNYSFEAELKIIVGNPFVFVPEEILKSIFEQAGRSKGPIPVCGRLNDKEYTQTLVKYSGAWRLYVNMVMLKNSPKRIGEKVRVDIEFDPKERTEAIHPKLQKALEENSEAKKIFENLSPSRQKEIKRYINHLKTETAVDKNVERAINFLLGKERFVGRAQP